MRTGLKYALVCAVALCGASVGVGGAAYAATACSTLSPDRTSFVVANSGCQFTNDGVKDNGSDPAGIINARDFFGTADWTLVSLNGGGPNFTASTLTSGVWDIGASFFSQFGEALLAFTDGGGDVIPTGIVGYLILSGNGTSGTWNSPFLNSAGAPKTISDIHVYGRGEPVNVPSGVPLPGAIWLLLSALGSLGVFSWWRRRASPAVA